MGNLTLNGQTVLTQVGTNMPEFDESFSFLNTKINRPAFCVYNSGSNQTLGTANSDTLVDFNNSYVDDQSSFDFNTNKYIIPNGFDGIYAFWASVQFGGTSNANQYNTVKIGKNGILLTSNDQRCYTTSMALTCNTFIFINCVGGDTIELYARHDGNTGTAVLHGTDGNTIFGGYRILGF